MKDKKSYETSKDKFSINFLSILITGSLILGTFIVYYLSKGYRINITNGELTKTGVVSVTTSPRRGRIYIDGEYVGNSPKAIAGVEEGRHQISIEKEGYQTWQTTINVIAEQSIPIYTPLFLEESEISEFFEKEQETEIDNIYFDQNNQTTIFTTYSSPDVLGEQDSTTAQNTDTTAENPTNPLTQPNTEGNNNEQVDPKVLVFWEYNINSQFWQTNQQPRQIFYIDPQELTDQESITANLNINNYKIKLAPNGQRLLLEIPAENNESESSNTDTQYFLVEINNDDIVLEDNKIATLSRYSDINPQWSGDSQYLIFTKDQELRSFNIDTQTQVILLDRDSDQYIWTQDQDNFLYVLEENKDFFDIYRMSPNGEKKDLIIEEIQKPSENTQNSDYACAAINSLKLVNSKYLLYFCEEKILIHNLEETDNQEIISIKAVKPQFIAQASSTHKFLYTTNNNEIYQYILEVEEGDPVHTVGTQKIAELDNRDLYQNFIWLDNQGYNLAFSKLTNEGSEASKAFNIAVLNTRSKQIFNLSSDIPGFKFAPTNNYEKIITECRKDTLCEITIGTR
jgi:hypothetical protein